MTARHDNIQVGYRTITRSVMGTSAQDARAASLRDHQTARDTCYPMKTRTSAPIADESRRYALA